MVSKIIERIRIHNTAALSRLLFFIDHLPGSLSRSMSSKSSTSCRAPSCHAADPSAPPIPPRHAALAGRAGPPDDRWATAGECCCSPAPARLPPPSLPARRSSFAKRPLPPPGSSPDLPRGVIVPPLSPAPSPSPPTVGPPSPMIGPSPPPLHSRTMGVDPSRLPPPLPPKSMSSSFKVLDVTELSDSTDI